jgi:hypothetical protein
MKGAPLRIWAARAPVEPVLTVMSWSVPAAKAWISRSEGLAKFAATAISAVSA